MTVTRRRVLQGALASTVVAGFGVPHAMTAGGVPTRAIPSTGEALAMVGLGSWVTFNVGEDPQLLDSSAAVIDAFLQGGGQMIDSSPMYGSAQATIGYGLGKRGDQKGLFSADKVWISNAARGPAQIEASRSHWTVPRFDLLQVHNMVAWERHLETLFQMKADGRLRYVGITTSHGRRHGDMEHIMRTHPLDFVQLTYNVVDREVEARLLPLAAEKGIAVIVNRPFQRGALTQSLARHPLPAEDVRAGATSWAQFLLKFILSHPAVTCVIPATSRVDHVRENLAAATGLPDAPLRQRMLDHVMQL